MTEPKFGDVYEWLMPGNGTKVMVITAEPPSWIVIDSPHEEREVKIGNSMTVRFDDVKWTLIDAT